MKTNIDYEELRNSMTVQDAARVLKETNCYGTMDIAKNVILKALEAQPSEDCISRKDIGLTNLEILMCNGDYKEALKMLLDKIEKAPSVTPQQKTGYWIEHKHGGIEHIECSKCKCWFLRKDLIRNSYCPNCGSRNHWEWELKMQEAKE